MESDYSKTLNLPQTEFSMRANLPQREPEMVAQWDADRLYYKLMEHNEGKPRFILHDGPPFANGDIHLGHALNKILKDIVVRYKNMSGFQAPFVPGWDTHGLPIEIQAIKKRKLKKDEMSEVEFREICHEFATKYIDNQKEQFKRLGVLGDFDNPYITLQKEFEAEQVEVFGEMARKGYIYKGLKPVYWCTDCQTALAEAEIEYAEDTTNSIYVRFRVHDGKGKFDGVDTDKVYFVIWTTTTWTLPGNVAIALNPNFDYVLMESAGEYYVVARELAEAFAATAKLESYEIVREFVGADLENITCHHPFLDRDSLVILGDHVTLDAGTGCVHTAPGHGAEDFIACQNYDLPIVVPVDDRGYLNEEAGKFAGMYYEKSNEAIIEELKSTNSLVAIEPIIHQYPHCWRCNKPIVFRATEQWFASIDDFKQDALDAIHGVKWTPAWGEERIARMVEDRNDWCISRQRLWGVPIPIFYCADCGKELINDETIAIVSKLFREKGSDAWYAMDADEILGGGFTCECGCDRHTKEHDIMDVWFDSGSSHFAVCKARPELGWPTDLYLEGNDQYRGWFQSSLLTSIAVSGKAPYREVLTHGMTIDDEGKKMSKSKGNVVDPLEVAKKYGVDILRLWVVTADFKTDMRMSDRILKQLSESYRKIRNTARYILGNLYDFNPDTDCVTDLEELDHWAVMKANELVKKSRESYDSYEFHMMYHAIHNFCVVDMSNFYLDVIKDRLYTSKPDSHARRSAQTAMYRILDILVRALAPVLCFTTEEIWKAMPHKAGDDLYSVTFNDIPAYDESLFDAALDAKYDRIRAARGDVSKALELARTDKTIGHSLGADVTLYATGDDYAFLKSMEAELPTLFIVSAAQVVEGEGEGYAGEDMPGLTVAVAQAAGEKCDRCWMQSETVGQDADHPTLCARCAQAVK
ncbi:MAG: isoleucine--tRNA ligase [Ruminococcaceae bacterium]|nr:isoleucine--tRNA ligase [Oscillospiraceae bacterium]